MNSKYFFLNSKIQLKKFSKNIIYTPSIISQEKKQKQSKQNKVELIDITQSYTRKTYVLN